MIKKIGFIIAVVFIYFCQSCTSYHPTPKCYIMANGDTIPQLDSLQIMNYIQEKGDTFHLIYCYGGGCPYCVDLLPEVISWSKKEHIPLSVMIIERAADSILINSAIKKLHQIDPFLSNIIILSDSLYDIKFRYQKPQTERISPIIVYDQSESNKYHRYIEQCVPEFVSYWRPRILLYHSKKGVIYDAKDSLGTAFSQKEKDAIYNFIHTNN